jgi:hypothetical protein
MNARAESQTRLVIVGATGMVGGYAQRYALDHPAVGVVTVIGRMLTSGGGTVSCNLSAIGKRDS